MVNQMSQKKPKQGTVAKLPVVDAPQQWNLSRTVLVQSYISGQHEFNECITCYREYFIFFNPEFTVFQLRPLNLGTEGKNLAIHFFHKRYHFINWKNLK